MQSFSEKSKALLLSIPGVVVAAMLVVAFFLQSPTPHLSSDNAIPPPSIYTEGLKYPDQETVEKTDAEWKELLSPELYHVAREDGTERPWVGRLLDNKEEGVYRCSVCGQPLFHSHTKFNSHTGWPSFYEPLHESHVKLQTDWSLGVPRTEVVCARCGSHLGHVFEDGPEPTGLRYCINDVSLQLDVSTSTEE